MADPTRPYKLMLAGGQLLAAVETSESCLNAMPTQVVTGLFTHTRLFTWLFLAAAVAGAISRTCTAPVDRLKMLLQIQDGAQALTLRGGLQRMAAEGAQLQTPASTKSHSIEVFVHTDLLCRFDCSAACLCLQAA